MDSKCLQICLKSVDGPPTRRRAVGWVNRKNETLVTAAQSILKSGRDLPRASARRYLMTKPLYPSKNRSSTRNHMVRNTSKYLICSPVQQPPPAPLRAMIPRLVCVNSATSQTNTQPCQGQHVRVCAMLLLILTLAH
ncbi:unnamed protein product [Pylaiella littoralis]